jgi:hypothetical protein
VSATFAVPAWYCVALRRASVWLAAMAHALEARSLDREAPPARDADAAFDARRSLEGAEERLREVRLRSLRYY